MAQWSRVDKTLYAKLVYYGPAFGGKTTNLESLHRITDPEGAQQLLSLRTSDDRTLFFDLLPFDLGTILGYQVAMKLYTVPGQVRYNATRRVVLAGVDAVVFVADSTKGHENLNRESLENLRLNLHSNRMNPDNIPVVFQFNKQDLPDALPPEEVAVSLGLKPGEGFPAAAINGTGVMETLMDASRKMLRGLASTAEGRTREELDVDQLDSQVDKAFEPILARLRSADSVPSIPRFTEDPENETIVATGEDLFDQAVQANIRLGEDLTAEKARAGRMEREAQALRMISETLRRTGASFDSNLILDRTLEVISQVVGAAVVTLFNRRTGNGPEAESVWGRPDDPLQCTPSGRRLLAKMMQSHGPCVVDDLQSEVGPAEGPASHEGIRAAVSIPVDAERRRVLVAYAPMPDGMFAEADIRFLATIAAHLAVGLEKARMHQQLAMHRDTLEKTVHARTEELRGAYEELRQLDRMKDRFLSNVSHEMRTPLTAIVNAASFLQGYDSGQEAREEMAGQILSSCKQMELHLKNLFRLVQMESDERLRLSDVTPTDLVAETMHLAGASDIAIEVDAAVDSISADLPMMARAVANLLDNAFKFASDAGGIEMRIDPAEIEGQPGRSPAVSIRILDRGPGVSEEDVERIFLPFEQGGDPMTSKPAGIGLGLHESRVIVSQHGGMLDYRPRVGGGSEFRITIPLASQQAVGSLEVKGA